MLDHETIDAMPEPEKRDLLGWLEDLVKYVRLKLGLAVASEAPETKPEVSNDPVGDIIIQGHIRQQRAASSGRKTGWMKIGYGNADDRHI